MTVRDKLPHMYDRILLPTDGEAGAEEATRHAVNLASACDATLHALYVVDEDVVGSYPGDEYVHEHEGAEAALEQAGEDALAAIEDAAASADIDVTTVLRHGSPATAIVEYADEVDADLVVVGTKSRPGDYRQLLGSVTERVARLTERPVTIVKTELPVE